MSVQPIYGVCLIIYSFDRQSVWTIREKITNPKVAKMAGDISVPMGLVLSNNNLFKSLHRLQKREIGRLLDLRQISNKTGRIYEKRDLIALSVAAVLPPWEILALSSSRPTCTEEVETIGWIKINELLSRKNELRYGVHEIINDLEFNDQQIWQIPNNLSTSIMQNNATLYSKKL